MNLTKDLSEFVALLNSAGVEYVLVGAYALAFHARPRFTEDIDILVRPRRRMRQGSNTCLWRSASHPSG